MSKIDLNQQARIEMSKILDKMVLERDAGNCKQYKTLSDTFERFFSMDGIYQYVKHRLFQGRYPGLTQVEVKETLDELHEDGFKFYNDILNILSGEVNGLVDILSMSLDKADYKEHHAWSIAYEKVTTIYREIDNVLNYK